jgi:hypothetical protein
METCDTLETLIQSNGRSVLENPHLDPETFEPQRPHNEKGP